MGPAYQSVWNCYVERACPELAEGRRIVVFFVIQENARSLRLRSGQALRLATVRPQKPGASKHTRSPAQDDKFKPILLALLIIFVFAVPATARSWRISNFHTDITVGDDGRTLVTERITLVFIGQYQGIHRTIPIQYPGFRGSNYTLFLEIRSVTDASGNALKYESSKKGAYRDLKIYIPGAVDTDRTVQISYSVRNAVRYFDNHDELYWNVTGNDWPVPIDHASAWVTLPPNATGGLRAQSFTGVYGSHDQEATSQIRGSMVEFETTNPLPMRGGLTIDVFIPKGVVRAPSDLTKFGWWLQSNPIVFVPLVAFAVMFSMWWIKGRDPEAGISVAPMYEPPPQMSPAEVGTLVDDSIDPRDITCTLVDLAVRGYIKIEQTTETRLLFFSSKDYKFHIAKPREEWSQLAPHERAMLNNIFFGGEWTLLSSLKNRFYTALPIIRDDVFSALRQKGMYLVDPESANKYRVLGVLLIAAPFVALQYFDVLSLFESAVVAAISIGLALLVVYLFGRAMTAKTIKGVRTVVQIRGFQEFMNRVDADRLQRMPPDTFEKYLPYAMALGVEQRWAEAFSGIVTQQPSWYVSPDGGGFHPVMFSNNMHAMSRDVQNVFVSSPRGSAGSSGFGGGGGSGGGFGGGGGSAF
jgi:uncharacterized membrane protein